MKRSKREKAYLRALLGPEGEDGENRREFGAGLTPKEQGAPTQVEEMREAAGVRKKTQAKGAAFQVREMRAAAAEADALAPLFGL